MHRFLLCFAGSERAVDVFFGWGAAAAVRAEVLRDEPGWASELSVVRVVVPAEQLLRPSLN